MLVSARLMLSGQGRDRTADTRIFSPVLYQLSYLSRFSKNELIVEIYSCPSQSRYLSIPTDTSVISVVNHYLFWRQLPVRPQCQSEAVCVEAGSRSSNHEPKFNQQWRRKLAPPGQSRLIQPVR